MPTRSDDDDRFDAQAAGPARRCAACRVARHRGTRARGPVLLLSMFAVLAGMAATANAYPILDEGGQTHGPVGLRVTRSTTGVHRGDQAAVVLALQPATQTAGPGQAVELSVVLTTTVAVRGFQMSVRFDPRVVQATGFDEGPFLKDWATAHGASTLVFPNPPPIDNAAGKAGVVGITLLGGGGGPSGSGRVGTWRFMVRPDAVGGRSHVTLTDVVVTDASGDEIADTVATGAHVEVAGPTATGGATTGATSTSAPPPRTATATATAERVGTRAPSATPDQLVRIDLEPRPGSVAPASAFDVTVKVTTDRPVRGMQLALTFDPGVVEATGFDKGSFLTAWADANGATVLQVPPVAPVDNAVGTVGVVGMSIMGGGDGGPIGAGEFGTFHFRTRPGATGSTRIRLAEGVVVNDAAGGEITSLVLGFADVTVDARAPTATSASSATPPGGAATTGTAGATAATGTATPSGPTTTPVVTATRTPTASRSSNTKFRISPASQRVAPGAPFDVHVEVEPDRVVLGAQIGLSFDPSVVEVKSVSEGDWLKGQAQSSGGVSVMVPAAPKIDNASGKVEVTGISIMGVGAQGASSKGILLTYKMAAKAGGGGKSALTLSGAVASDSTGDELSISSVTNGEVTVDVNAPTPTASSVATASGSAAASGTVIAAGTGTPGASGTGTPGVSGAAPANATGTAGARGGVLGAPISSDGLRSMLGAGGPGPTPAPAVVDLEAIIGEDDTLDQDLNVSSGAASLYIAKGTRVTMAGGEAIGSLGIRVAAPAPVPPGGSAIIGFAYSFDPNGAVFSPPARISIGFDPAALPTGVGPEDLRLARFDPATATWVDVVTIVDGERRALSAEADRFGVFAVLAPVGGIPWPLLGGLLAVELLAAFAAVVVARRRLDGPAYRFAAPVRQDVKLLMPPRQLLLADALLDSRPPRAEAEGVGPAQRDEWLVGAGNMKGSDSRPKG